MSEPTVFQLAQRIVDTPSEYSTTEWRLANALLFVKTKVETFGLGGARVDCNNCHKCLEEKTDDQSGLSITSTRMLLCPTCGNKRCPKASNHIRRCTNSNEPGQIGSIY